MCGENFMRWTIWHMVKGSPPRVRGKQSHDIGNLSTKRITPACAGKTDNYIEEYVKAKDHPRVCGENQDAA